MKVCHSVVSNSLGPHELYLPGSSIHRILQARILEWVSIPFSRGSSWPRDWTWVSCIGSTFFTIWSTTQMVQLSGPLVQFQINCSISNQLAYFYIFVTKAACFLVSKCLLVSLDFSNQWPQLSGLKQLKWNLWQFLEPAFQNQGVNRAMLPPKAPEVNPTLPLSLCVPLFLFAESSVLWDLTVMHWGSAHTGSNFLGCRLKAQRLACGGRDFLCSGQMQA